MRALTEAAAARQNAEFDRLIAEKERERGEREAEERRNREQERARYQRDIDILAADKKVAVADAKLRAIEQAITEEEFVAKSELPDVPFIKTEKRTMDWVETHPTETKMPHSTPRRPSQTEAFANVTREAAPKRNDSSPQRAFGKPIIASTPHGDASESQLIHSMTLVNQQIVAGLARQNLPKCHPDIFSGDATLFHPWKTAFKAMITDADVSPTQEVNYLRKFTSGDVQRVVDNFRRRQQQDPITLLSRLWSELERRFGSAAVITNALLERMQETAAFGEPEVVKLQNFADLCADVESQVTQLPGLACLNFPNAIQPIADKLPSSLRRKWEKKIAEHAEKSAGAYPSFQIFSKVIQDHNKIRNNPNLLAGKKKSPVANAVTGSTLVPRRANKKALKTRTHQDAPREPRETKPKHCPFHERDGHDLAECKAFSAKSLEDRTQWIQHASLCFRCLSDGHVANKCTQKIQCSICGDDRHIALLHKEKPGDANVNNSCTAVCSRAGEGGVSCGKILLVDVFSSDSPEQKHRVYAIIDEQSNSSLISSELADELGVKTPPEKYYLSTCSSEREVKYGRRVTGLTVRSLMGTTSALPALVECDSIPQDKREIPTPEMARRFTHLQQIASEIPPLDETADIHLLIGRDAPELLKVREFKNGPRGAPWAQRLSLGWTITGQMCLDLVDGPAHVVARRTSLNETSANDSHSPQGYELAPCPNRIRVTDSLSEPGPDPLDDVFRTTREDNEPSLSCEDRKFLEIMEKRAHTDERGNWEMPLPFRREKPSLPNNRSQAIHRLNGLLRTLRKKPQMERDYLEFMEKILSKGHASPVPADEPEVQPGRVWYLPHFGVYHPKKPTQIRVVFDSSAEFGGVSLNKELLAGPDFMNSLTGVLLRFRRESITVMSDIEQMFHSFRVEPSHRDFLRFLWYKDNTPGKPIVEYRMNVHLFGNGPSPAVATYGLRRTATDGEEKFGKEAADFVHRNFYVDDGLISLPTAEQAVKLVTTAQAMLATANLRLHKVVSNSREVMEAFPTEDRGKDVRDLDLRRDSLPDQ